MQLISNQDYDVATTFGAAFVKHIGCGDGGPLSVLCQSNCCRSHTMPLHQLPIAGLRNKPADEILNNVLMFPFEFKFPPNAKLPLLLPIFPVRKRPFACHVAWLTSCSGDLRWMVVR